MSTGRKEKQMQMSEEEYLDLVNEQMGLCLSCGAERECCEPDARHYDCPECGENEVFGVEELLMEGKIEFV